MTESWRKDIKDAMWSMFWLTKDKQKADLQQLKEDIETLIQMTTQKTSGQRKNKDISWDNLERVQMNIICGAATLYLTGWLDEQEAAYRKGAETMERPAYDETYIKTLEGRIEEAKNGALRAAVVLDGLMKTVEDLRAIAKEKDAAIEKYEKALVVAAEDFNRATAEPHDAFDFRKHYTGIWKQEAGL